MKNLALAIVLLFVSVFELFAQQIEFTDFSSGDLSGWTAVNGSSKNKWEFGLSIGYNLTGGAQISNDGGTTNSYSTSQASVVHLYKDIDFSLANNLTMLTFRWRSKGELGKDFMSVHLVPTDVDPVAGEELNQGQVGRTEYSDFGYYRGARIKFESDLITSPQMRVVFSWRNDDTGGEQPPASIDNIEITNLDLPYGMWKTHLPMPGQRYYAGSTRNGYSITIAGGDITGGGFATNQVLEYNMIANRWSQLPPLQEPIRLNSLVKFDGALLSLGGFKNGSNDPTDEINKMDLNDFTWNSFGVYPKKTFYSRGIVMNWQYLYMIGGSDENSEILNDVNYMEAGTNTWKPATPIPGDGRADGGATALDDSRILLVGGYTNQFERLQVDSVFIGTISSTNPAEITWESAPNFPGGPRARFYAYRWGNGKAIVVGGSNSDAFPSFNDVWVFDANAESGSAWTQLSNKPTPITAYQGTSMRIADNVWVTYIIGGITTGPSLTAINEAFIDTLETPVSVEEITNEIPTGYFLSQNYPNPFNPSTSIEYSLPSESFVELKVYDVLGNEVASLVNEQQQAGVYRVDFIVNNLSSGMYVARITANDFAQVVKMILLK